jgi:hypothetical protein
MKRFKIPEYVGTIIVCLDKARPFSQVPNGRELIGNLTHIKIRTSNIKKQFTQTESQVYNERDIAVPVFIYHKDSESSVDSDWTRTSSPITEIKCGCIQRWWPRSIFKGSQKIGDIAEEIVFEYPKFTMRLHVAYAFTSDLKELFSDINDDKAKLDMDEYQRIIVPIVNELISDNKKYIPNKPELKEPIPGDPIDNTSTPKLPVVMKNKNNSKVKYVVGSIIIGAVAAGLFFGIRWLKSKKE